VVDGQQRLTTSLILLQALLEQLKEGDELNYSSVEDIKRKYVFESKDKGISRSYIFGYEKDNPSYEFLKTRIFLEKSDNHEIGEQTIYTHNLLFAKEFFTDKLGGMTIPSLEAVFAKLTQHFLFNIYTISGGIDVFVAFETMNNRRKPLSHLELLKNRLIFLSTRLGADSTERAKVRSVVNEAWKTAYHYLGRNQKRPLNDDDFLGNQFILYVGPTLYGESEKNKETNARNARLDVLLRGEEYKTYLLDEMFTSRNIQKGNSADGDLDSTGVLVEAASGPPITSQRIYDYAHDLKTCVETYYRVLNPHDSEFSGDQKVVLAQLNRLGWHGSLPLVLAVVIKSKGQGVTEFFTSLERHLFLRSLVSPPYYRYESMDLIELAMRFKTGGASLRDIVHTLRTKTDQIIPMISTSELIPTAFHRGYYAWRCIRYFLFEYEQELKRKARAKRDKLIWEEFAGEHYEEDYATIEHVYPQRPKSDEWKKQFSQFDQKQKTALRNSLGNLVALSRPKNSALGNRSFADKKKGTDETSGYVAGSYSGIEVSQFEEWTAKEILDRGLKMWAFMEKRWQFKLKDRKEQIRALGLAFLE
jgi:hypothetical protein